MQNQAAKTQHATPHVVPMPLLIGIWISLLILTGLTVGATYIDLGSFNIWLALLIAVAKASLVALFFMHLRWSSPFNAVILICALLFVAIFIAMALLDTTEYQTDYHVPRGVTVIK